MTRTSLVLLCVGMSAVCWSAGCANGRTQWPSLWNPRPHAAHPAVGSWRSNQARLDERHDPHPSTDAGPQLFTRPRGFVAPRAGTRRFQEEQYFRRGTTNTPSGPPPGSAYQQSYGDVIR